MVSGLVLGIDPSYTCTGCVVLNRSYQVVTYTKIRLAIGPKRMLRGAKAMHSFIKEIPPQGKDGSGLSLAVLEDAAYGAPSRITVAKLKELSGVYKAVLDGHDIPWIELSPSAAKRFITGKGTSEKWMVAREIESKWNIAFRRDEDKGWDLSDATALAIWGVSHGQKAGKQEAGRRGSRG